MNKKHQNISFIAIILGFFMALLDTTVVNITLPKMAEYFSTSMDHISWVVNSYNLATAVILITVSRLADQFGRKKLFIAGVAVFTISSLLCGISDSLQALILFRTIQGIAAAFVVTIAAPLSIEIFPPEKRRSIMALWGAFSGLAAASGPSIGGIVTQFLNWRYIFFINIPIGCICILLTMKFIKESYDPTASKSIDFGGIITISVSMLCLTFALMKANERGWSSSFILSFFAVSAITLILFIIIERKVKEPMVPLSLFKSVPFTSGSITVFLIGVGMMSGTYLLSFFLIQVKGLSQLSAGLIISTMSLTSMCFSLLAPILTKRLGSRVTSALGILLLCISCYLNSSLTQNSSNIDIILRLIVAGSGTGLSMATLIGSIMANVPVEKIGIASGINNMTRTLGTVLGVALFLTIFTSNMTIQMSDARDSVVQTIQNDTVFDDEAKLQMISSIKAGSNKNASLSEILNTIDEKETAVLASSPAMDENKIKESFEAQKKEIQKIVPNIQDTFLTHTVKSFSFTFKVSAAILLPGILFALFSDKKRSSEIENNSFVKNTSNA
ncbi:MFS transporter [Clostridium saccharobutylicum]|uniref:Tetracenomycin C resistance and export protein TcmA n=1 Tax=Clostridium saccharobutylicum DSM 13864 TaxID=1345695 RepID=U5MV12_CLOSA|nr:MFS transporter [Clostridium saccharobutylicum]AGX44405.1 tetracenomycin C resistance and export protein TcmA [Clostridium saccharobutylicum DSM 13864]AQR91696.1 multidrug resistance protein 3 [Clostridium saccharobutylicum]AQS01600.1 multidrug resistance protein 3 [Clostridium saccharobutylicum]AQS11210.1 multidrug resistance protein 3 [Clostridium saccharobutylicum]AQS15583.1 multidrug resistance protein 3 [Clostridium saccharobutylicum]